MASFSRVHKRSTRRRLPQPTAAVWDGARCSAIAADDGTPYLAGQRSQPDAAAWICARKQPHADRCERPGLDARRGRHRHHGPRHRAGLRAGRHERHRLRREGGRRRSGQGFHAEDARPPGREGLAVAGRLPRPPSIAHHASPSTLEQVAKADVIIEAVFERLDIKQELFAKLDALAGPDTIIATNTSSLPVTSIAARTKHPERVGGMHFFNPGAAHAAGRGHPRPAHRTVGHRRADDHRPAHDARADPVHRQPRLPRQPHRPRHGARVPAHPVENIASHAEIDRIMTGAPGFRMGPFTLADLVGIDVDTAAWESMYAQFYQEPAYAPSPLIGLARRRRSATARRRAAGWYSYKDGKKQSSRRPSPRLPRARRRSGCGPATTTPTCKRRCSSCSAPPASRSSAATGRAPRR